MWGGRANVEVKTSRSAYICIYEGAYIYICVGWGGGIDKSVQTAAKTLDTDTRSLYVHVNTLSDAHNISGTHPDALCM
jgi:hypothetical protein